MLYIPRTLANNLIFIINQTSKNQVQQFDDQMRELKLDKSQWRALGYLAFFNKINQSELARLMGMGKAPLGQLIHKMESHGWVERKPSTSDKRSYNLMLSPKLERLAQLIKELMELESERLLKGLSTEDKIKLSDYMLHIKSNIREIPPSKEIELQKKNIQAEIDKLNS